MGDPRVNGWYHQREMTDGPPRGCPTSLDDCWTLREDVHWYEKDDGCYIYQLRLDDIDSGDDNLGYWFVCVPVPDRPDGDVVIYACHQPAGQMTDAPPAGGWKKSRRYGTAPGPTLRVVD